MALELYRDKNHACLMFTDLIEEDGQAVQANQFLIVDDDTGAIIDPGGNGIPLYEVYAWLTVHGPEEQSIMSAPAALKALAISTASSGVMPPSTQSCAEMRTDMGLSAGHTARTALKTSSG